MIIRHLEDITGTACEVTAENNNWVSRRLLLKKDSMGFSFHDTIIFPGTETPIHYKHHLEAVYCIEGKGEIESSEDGKKYPILPGMLYALDKHDRHILRCSEKLRLICVFVPPLTGEEKHREDGSYKPDESPDFSP